MIKNRPAVSQYASPSKAISMIKDQYQRIVDRVRDDAILRGLSIPLPKINNKCMSTFISREEKKANLRATVMPKVKPHTKVLSTETLPDAPVLPTSLPSPARPQGQYPVVGVHRIQNFAIRPDPNRIHPDPNRIHADPSRIHHIHRISGRIRI